MDPFHKIMAQEMLGKMAEKKSEQGMSQAQPSENSFKQFVASMKPEEFQKFAEQTLATGDKDKIANLIENWPHKS